MAEKKVTYKEPKGYFNAEMLKVAKQWDKEHAASKKAETPKKQKSK